MQKTSWHCFWALIYADLLAFRQIIVDRYINFLIWVTATTTVAGYLFPAFGMRADYGQFFLASVFASVGMFEAYGRVAELVTDMSGDRPLLYYVTLPISSFWFVIRIMLSNSFRFMVLGLCVLPAGKLILGSKLSFAAVQLIPLILLYVVINLFYGSTSVWLACRVPSILGISNVWMRIVFPVWFLGGFQFSQAILAATIPVLYYINLFNPIMYMTEGMRASILGQTGYTNVWVCIGVIMIFWILTTWRGIAAMRHRLDLY